MHGAAVPVGLVCYAMTGETIAPCFAAPIISAARFGHCFCCALPGMRIVVAAQTASVFEVNTYEETHTSVSPLSGRLKLGFRRLDRPGLLAGRLDRPSATPPLRISR